MSELRKYCDDNNINGCKSITKDKVIDKILLFKINNKVSNKTKNIKEIYRNIGRT